MHDRTLKHEIDAREQHARDKEMLYAWRRRVSGDKAALDVKLRLDSDFENYLEQEKFR